MRSYLFVFALIAFLGCTARSDNPKTESQVSEYGKLPPPMPPEEQSKCDSLKANAYFEVSKGEITIAFNDTIRNDQVLYRHFVTTLKNNFGFRYFRLYDVGFESVAYKQCVLPIMDSAIVAIYGINAKDSFVNLVYRMADTAFLLE